MNPPEPSWRKPAGAFLIMAIILVWTVIVVTVAGYFEGIPILLQALLYMVAGIAWIVPVRPILVWMELGKWR